MFDIVVTPFGYGRGFIVLITSVILQDNRKYSACDLKCRYSVFTLWGSSDDNDNNDHDGVDSP